MWIIWKQYLKLSWSTVSLNMFTSYLLNPSMELLELFKAFSKFTINSLKFVLSNLSKYLRFSPKSCLEEGDFKSWLKGLLPWLNRDVILIFSLQKWVMISSFYSSSWSCIFKFLMIKVFSVKVLVLYINQNCWLFNLKIKYFIYSETKDSII